MSVEDRSVTTDDQQEVMATQGGVRWKRFAGMLTLTGALAAGLVALTAQGVLASQFSISGMPFVVTADRLDGTGFEQFATMDTMIEDSPNAGDTGGQVVVIVSAINQATLTNLCQSVSLGGKYLKITAGDGKDKVAAKTLVVDSDLISGDATFGKIKIGQDSSTFNGSNLPDGGKQVDQVPGVNGGEGVFGQQADTVEILNLRQNNYATTAATFKLPHLRMTFTDDGC
jgi:uncharacterized protein DUF6230